jgi:hypothetical protein
MKKETAMDRRTAMGLMMGLPGMGRLWAQDGAGGCRKCGKETYGTSVEWAAGTQAAADQALKEEKLVLVLHVSGYFEDARFT